MLEDLPGAVELSEGMTHLLVGDNRLAGLPAEIGKLEKLVVLDIHKNDIVEMGKCFFEFEINNGVFFSGS